MPAEVAAVDPDLLTLRNLNTREDYVAALSTAGFDTEPGQSSQPR